jgi:hypothetical protein
MDAAAAKGPIDLASEASAYKANQSSLTGLVKNRDAVTAFESTAGKNLDLLLGQAGKIVDSGSPWINQPLRSVDQKGLGSEDLAAYNAARQVAINEVAKVTSNPALSGNLTDSARHEVEAFIPADATLAQTYRVAKILKQDMANRHQSYNDQIADISSRIGRGGVVNDQGPRPATPSTPPRVTTQAEYNALLPGTVYTEPDGMTYQKPKPKPKP